MDDLSKLALDIVNLCRKGDAAETVAEMKVLPLLKEMIKKPAENKKLPSGGGHTVIPEDVVQ